MEKLYTVEQNKPESDHGSDHELLIEKPRLKFKKVGKFTRPFRYNLNKIPYDYITLHATQSVQLFCHVWLFVTPWTAACQTSLFITNSQSLLKLMFIASVMPSNHLIPLSSPSPPAFNLSQHQGLFQWAGSSQQVAKILELQLHHHSFQWTSRVDCL